MKAGHVIDSVSRSSGGLFFSVRHLTRSLAAMPGMTVVVHGLRDAHSEADAEQWLPLDLRIHTTHGPRALAYSPELAREVDSGEYDLLHNQHIWQWPSAAVHQWHRRTRRPYLISPRGMLDPWALARSRWKKRMALFMYESAHLRDAACFHALCRSEADSIRTYGLRNPVCIIPNGVDLPEISYPTSGHRPLTLLFLGRLHPKKGLVNALRAWHSHLRSTNHDPQSSEWKFVIAGWDQGGHEAELKRLCTEIGLTYADVPPAEFVSGASSLSTARCSLGNLPSVVFTGPAFGEQKDALLRSATVFILPSFSEGLPMSVLEAWSYQLPVLMTDHCNLPEGFAANAAIRIGTDVKSIAEGMSLLIRSPISDLRSLGANGRQLVSERFTWSQIAVQMKGVYEWILGGGNVPDCMH